MTSTERKRIFRILGGIAIFLMSVFAVAFVAFIYLMIYKIVTWPD